MVNDSSLFFAIYGPLSMLRCTEEAHRRIASVLSPGDGAIDLTAGNGYDTLFLLRKVAPLGKVYAFDIQLTAIQKTADRCCSFGDSLRLICQCHSRVRAFIPLDAMDRVGAVMANLGYLPGGDTGITTHDSTSVRAVRESLPFLRPGGIASVICYRGHPGGEEETEAMMRFFAGLSKAEWEIGVTADALAHPVRPVWCWAQRRSEG